MKKFILTILALLVPRIFCYAESIYFDNELYKLKYSGIASQTKGYGNEYFRDAEGVSKWSKMIGVYLYPEEENPLEYATNYVKTIENTENSLLLKFIENKKSDKAVVSFLVNGAENNKKYFEYDIFRFEKYNKKEMLVVKYAVKYYFNNNSEIKKIAEKIKTNNDKLLETIVMSQTPKVIEKDISMN